MKNLRNAVRIVPMLLMMAALQFSVSIPLAYATVGKDCNGNGDCSSGEICNVVGTCSLASVSTVSGSCSKDADCSTGQVCTAAKCVAKTTTSPTPAATTNTTGSGNGTLTNPLKVASLDALLDLVLKAVVQLGGIILTLALIWTGFKFVAARGNEEALSSAKRALMWTVIGGLILLGAEGIKTVITSSVSTL